VSLLESQERQRRRFGSLVAVRNVSLTVEPGELRAIIGPNGAGKTTFFNLISGLFAPDRGRDRVRRSGTSPNLVPHRRVAPRHGAHLSDHPKSSPSSASPRTCRIGIEVASGYRLRAWLRRAEDKAIRERVAEILALTNLASKADRIVGELSHGDQRAAEISMALTLKPRILLLGRAHRRHGRPGDL